MKRSICLALFLLFYHLHPVVVEKAQTSKIAYAVYIILEQYLAKNSWTVDLIGFGVGNGESQNLINKILQINNNSVSLSVSVGGAQRPWKNRLNTSSILTFDSLQDFEKVRDNITWQSHTSKRFQHLVNIPNVTIADLEKNSDGFSIDNVNFLTQRNQNSIELVTSFMYTKNKCRSNQFFIINQFNSNAMEWESITSFYPHKYHDFLNS